MSVLVAADTPHRARAAAAALPECTLPRAVHSPDPFIRLIGWFLVGQGGSWSGRTSVLWEALQDEAAPEGASALGATPSALGRKLFAARRDLEEIGIGVVQRDRRAGGVRARVLEITARDIRPLTPAPRSEVFDRWADAMIVAGDFEHRDTAQDFWLAYVSGCALDGVEPWPFRTFCVALKRHAEIVGAYPVVIDGRKGWKGMRLARPQPSPVTEAAEAAVAVATEEVATPRLRRDLEAARLTRLTGHPVGPTPLPTGITITPPAAVTTADLEALAEDAEDLRWADQADRRQKSLSILAPAAFVVAFWALVLFLVFQR